METSIMLTRVRKEIERKGYKPNLLFKKGDENAEVCIFIINKTNTQDYKLLIAWKSVSMKYTSYYILSEGLIEECDATTYNDVDKLLDERKIKESPISDRFVNDEVFDFLDYRFSYDAIDRLLTLFGRKERSLKVKGREINNSEKSFYSVRISTPLPKGFEFEKKEIVYNAFSVSNYTYIIFNNFGSLLETKKFLNKVLKIVKGDILLTSDIYYLYDFSKKFQK